LIDNIIISKDGEEAQPQGKKKAIIGRFRE